LRVEYAYQRLDATLIFSSDFTVQFVVVIPVPELRATVASCGRKRNYITASEKVVGAGRLLNCGSGEIASSSKCDVTSSSVNNAWEMWPG